MEPRRDILREQLRGYLAEQLASLQHLKLEEVAGLLQNVDGPLEMTVPVDLALLMDVGASSVPAICTTFFSICISPPSRRLTVRCSPRVVLVAGAPRPRQTRAPKYRRCQSLAE